MMDDASWHARRTRLTGSPFPTRDARLSVPWAVNLLAVPLLLQLALLMPTEAQECDECVRLVNPNGSGEPFPHCNLNVEDGIAEGCHPHFGEDHCDFTGPCEDMWASRELTAGGSLAGAVSGIAVALQEGWESLPEESADLGSGGEKSNRAVELGCGLGVIARSYAPEHAEARVRSSRRIAF